MTKQLTLARGFHLPLEAVTETFALLAKRGAGKSYTAAVLIEQMLQAALQSKGFVNAVSRLRTLGFIAYQGRGGPIVALPVLFLEG